MIGTVDCGRCYGPIRDFDPAIHDQGTAWHRDCRKELIAELAERKADRLIARKPELAAVLAEIQRRPQAMAA